MHSAALLGVLHHLDGGRAAHSEHLVLLLHRVVERADGDGRRARGHPRREVALVVGVDQVAEEAGEDEQDAGGERIAGDPGE